MHPASPIHEREITLIGDLNTLDPFTSCMHTSAAPEDEAKESGRHLDSRCHLPVIVLLKYVGNIPNLITILQFRYRM